MKTFGYFMTSEKPHAANRVDDFTPMVRRSDHDSAPQIRRASLLEVCANEQSAERVPDVVHLRTGGRIALDHVREPGDELVKPPFRPANFRGALKHDASVVIIGYKRRMC